jgi:hypothetical protein
MSQMGNRSPQKEAVAVDGKKWAKMKKGLAARATRMPHIAKRSLCGLIGQHHQLHFDFSTGLFCSWSKNIDITGGPVVAMHEQGISAN